jgi:hypothetical protein
MGRLFVGCSLANRKPRRQKAANPNRRPSLSATRLNIAKRLAEFTTLPDDAIIPEPVAAALLGMSTDTYRRAKPLPRRRIAKRLVGVRAGDLRALVRGEAAA